MATNLLSEFIAHIKKNSIARTNRFRVNFSLPSVVDIGDSGVEKALSLTCLMADIPTRTSHAQTINYGNYDRKVAFGRDTGDFNTTFLLTGKYVEKRLFDSWQRTINDESQHAVEFYDNYVASITVECLNEADQVVYSFELTEAHPLFVGNLKLDRTAQNQQMTLDVTWAYHRIVSIASDIQLDGSVAGGSGVIPPVAIPDAGAGKQRLLPIPGIDQMSAAVQSAANTIKEFHSQLQGVLARAKDVREQVRDFKMSSLDGVKALNSVVKDVKDIKNIPTDVKNEVVSVVTDTRNQIGYLKDDVRTINQYPKR